MLEDNPISLGIKAEWDLSWDSHFPQRLREVAWSWLRVESASRAFREGRPGS